MKKKNTNSLRLQKKTISNLDTKKLNTVKGGLGISIVCTVSISALICDPTDDPYGTSDCMA